jgi:hypothetical protein
MLKLHIETDVSVNTGITKKKKTQRMTTFIFHFNLIIFQQTC